MDRNPAASQRRQLLLVIIDQNDVVAEISKTRSCNQADVSRSHDCDVHRLRAVIGFIHFWFISGARHDVTFLAAMPALERGLWLSQAQAPVVELSFEPDRSFKCSQPEQL